MAEDIRRFVSTELRRQLQRGQGFTETGRAELGWGLDMTPEKRDEVLKVQRGIQTMEDRLLRHNVAAPPPERQIGTLQKILGFLRRGETAPAIMAGIRGESMGRAYWQSAFGAEPLQRISYSDVFSELGWRPDSTIGKWIKGAAGLAADILLDPTTWLTFGKGGAIKLKARIKGEICELGLNRTGTDMLKRYVGEFGEKEGRIKMSQFLTDQKDLGKYVVPDGLKFMGQQIPIIGRREVVTAPFRFVDWMGRNAPLVNTVYKKADDLLREAFVPFSKINKFPAMRTITAGHKIDVEDGTAFKELYLRTIKGTRAEQLRETKHILDLSKKAKEALPKEKELGKTLSEALEAGRPTGFKVLDDVLDFARRRHKEMFFKEQKYKITTHELPNYLKHVLTKEGRDFVNKGGDIVSHLPEPLRIRLTQPRKIQGAIRKINEEWMKKHGHKLFEEDFFKIFALRTAEHIHNVRLYEFFQEVSRRWGVLPETYWKQSIHPITGKVTREKIVRPLTVPVQGGIRFVESAVPQLKGVLFPEPIVKHLDSYHKFLNEEEVSNWLLRQYDRLLRFWKVSVTGIWPAFHTRNIYGSFWNNWLRGLNDPIRYKQAHDVVTGKKGNITIELGTKYDYAQINRLMDDLGLSTQPGMLDVYKTTEDLLEKGRLKKALDAPLGITEAVERRVRGALFIDRLIKGDTPEDAAKAVFATLFDYSPEGLTAFERNVMRRIAPFYRWCLSADTEILTKEGWKKYNEIQNEEEVLTWNSKTQELEWQQIQEKMEFDFEGKIMAFKNNRHHWQFTPEHNWFVLSKYKKQIVEKKGYELIDSDRFPLTGFYKEKKSILTPQEAAILGWIVTDGYYRKRENYFEMMIYQSPKKHLNKIFELLEIDKKQYNRKPHPITNVYCINVPKHFVKKITEVFSSKEDLPRIVCQLSYEAAKTMWEAMFLAEGSSVRNNEKKFVQFNKSVLDAFQILTLLIGKTAVVKNYGCYIKEGKYATVRTAYLIKEDYSGKVWCVSTPNQTFIARRNGSPFITGNSRGNIPYQTEMLIKHPGKFAVLPKFKNMFDDMADGGRQQVEQERSLMPEWMSEMFTLRLPGAVPKYIQLDLPATDLNTLPIGASGWRNVVSMISPFLKYPVERWIGRDFYFGGDLWNPNLPRHLQTREVINPLFWLPQPIQLFLGFREVTKPDPVTGKPKKTYEMDARKVHALRTFLGRFWSTYARIIDEDQTTTDKISHLVTGTPIREVDVTAGKQRKLYDRQRQLRALVGYYRKRGIIPKEREEEQDDIRNRMRKYFDIYFRR